MYLPLRALKDSIEAETACAAVGVDMDEETGLEDQKIRCTEGQRNRDM